MRDKLGLPDPDPAAKPEDLLQPPGVHNQSKLDEETPEIKQPTAVAKNSMERQQFTAEQQALEDLADTALSGVDLGDNEQRILEAVLTADSYEQVVANLLDLYPELDMSGLREMTERALVAAELYGRMTAGEADAANP